METKKRVGIIKGITIVSFIINCTSVIFTIWVNNYITKFVASTLWFISQCWIMLFIYANFIYVPKDKIRLKKRRPKSRFWAICKVHKKIEPNLIRAIDFIGLIILSPIFLICSYRFTIGVDMGYMALFDLCVMLVSYLGIAGMAIEYIPEKVWTRIIP